MDQNCSNVLTYLELLIMSAGDNEGGQKSISTQLMQNPDLLAALQVSFNP